ncbi:titin [Burkholderia singularis]|uniref:Titin n=1 Tax=Burkholderia singularis TaxID=1503053 RepID=A0A238HBV6_9BURK|nr:titin [Burkholderia singularis]
MRFEHAFERARIRIAVHRHPHRLRIAAARAFEIHHAVGGETDAARECVVACLPLHDQQFVFLEERTVRIELLVEHRHFALAGAVVEQRDHHLAALGHLRAQRHDHAGHELVAPFLQFAELVAREAPHLVAVGIEQMAGQVKTERGLLLLQPALVVPRRLVDERVRMRGLVAHVEEPGLQRIRFRLIGRLHRERHRCDQLRAVRVQRVERAGSDQRFDRAAVDHAPVDPHAEIKQIGKRLFFARTQDLLDRVLPAALHRAEAVADRLRALAGRLRDRLEPVAGMVDVGRQHREAVCKTVVEQDLHLVGVVHRERHVSGHEFGRMVRLQPRGVVRKQRVCRRMRLVEAVARELLHQVEDLVGLFARQAILRGAFGENLAMLGHLLRLLLAHRTAQQIRAAERIAANDLRHLHHLLLIDHDPVGLFQDGLDARVRIIDFLASVLARAEARDQVHRPRPVQRYKRDDVLEAVGLRILQHPLHPAAFKLEHRDRVRFLEDLERSRIVERHLRERPVGLCRIEPADVALGPIEDRQRRQTQKVELHEADRLDVILVVLADDAAVVALRVQRAEIGELARCDQHAARMHPDVARQTLDALREVEQLMNFVLVVVTLLQERLFLHRVGNCHVLARLERDQLRHAVGEHIAEIEHAADIAHGRLRGHRAEGGDLRHRVRAVLLLHVLDHAVAAVLAEIDIEVGHRHPLRIQKALEQQVVAQRIEIGDTQRIGNERARAGAAARPDRHTVVFRPVDEVRDDQEVAGKAHLLDRSALEIETLVIRGALRIALGRVRIELREAFLEPFLGQLHEIVVERHPVGRRKERQLRLAEFERQVAALGDLDRVRERRRQIREQRGHLVLRTEILVGRETLLTARIRQDVAFRDAHARLVRGEIVSRHELQRMRRDDGQLQFSRERHGLLDIRFGAWLAITLQFDVETARKQLRPARGVAARGRVVTGRERNADVALLRARQREQPFGKAVFKPTRVKLRAAAVLVREPRLGQQLAKIQVAALVLDEQQQARRFVAIIVIGDPDVAAGNRLDARAAGFLVKTDETERVAEVGQCERALSVAGRRLDDVVKAHDAVGDREFGMDAKMNEAGI